MNQDSKVVSGEILDESIQYTLKEVCEVCGTHAEHVLEMVEIGIIEPRGEQPSDWRFTALTLFRSRKALRLQRDLEINLQGVAVALDLMDEIDSLRDRVNSLQQQLGKLQR